MFFTLSPAQKALKKKMNYLIKEVGRGQLSFFEEGELLELLEKAAGTGGMYQLALKQHFDAKNQDVEVDDKEMIKTLASQCQDDFITMCAVFGQRTVILLLRTLQ